MAFKRADLLPDVKLQEHQERLREEALSEPVKKLLIWAMGSGKSLGALSAAEAHGEPYTAIVPASLRANIKKEQTRFTDKETPSHVLSYSELAKGKPVQYPSSLLFDEAQALRNPVSARARAALGLSDKAKQVLLMSATPIVHTPGELAVPLQLLTGKKMTPAEFESRYVGSKNVYPNIFRRLIGSPSGTEPVVAHEKELKALLKGHVDYYDPSKPVVPVHQEDVPTTMGVEQSRLYKAVWDQLPWFLRWKLKHNYPLSRKELIRLQSFLTGPRQIGLSTYPYQRAKDPLRAFEQSGKLKEAHKRLQEHLKDPRKKALVFANFIDAGLTPYSAALSRDGVPHAVFHGGLSDSERKKLVEDYNDGRIRVALLGPSGTEGLSFKGTGLTQLLDPHWSGVRPSQAVGRGLRFDSHLGLPEDLKNMKVERYIARLPMGFKDRLLSGLGFDRTESTIAADDRLMRMSETKEKLNRKFIDLLREVGTRR